MVDLRMEDQVTAGRCIRCGVFTVDECLCDGAMSDVEDVASRVGVPGCEYEIDDDGIATACWGVHSASVAISTSGRGEAVLTVIYKDGARGIAERHGINAAALVDRAREFLVQ